MSTLEEEEEEEEAEEEEKVVVVVLRWWAVLMFPMRLRDLSIQDLSINFWCNSLMKNNWLLTDRPTD